MTNYGQYAGTHEQCKQKDENAKKESKGNARN